jgi:N utilization substance protein B
VGKRRKGRELVVQACYASQLAGRPLDACVEDQLVRRQPAPETAAFARRLSGILADHQREIDVWLRRLLEHWAPERVGEVERAVLRLALAELRHCPDVPWRVVINEACELARRFGSEEAVAFVNGILDRAAAEVLEAEGTE